MAKVLTKFIRKRNANTALTQNKLSARVQVTSNSQTFMFKKTATSAPPPSTFTYLQPDGNDYFQPDGSSRYLQP
jgi:hypothetical protein